ncbi:MAG: hypothetical protein OEX81_04225 [Candidatus Pacebacteria bacterium]|nr:hypothetical protein [Candidatus Paceibacterota bacterium]
MTKNIVSQNSEYPRCVDGREAVAFVEWDGSNWIVPKKNEEATKEVGPQFLGASLLFVKVLEEIAGKDRDDAFRMVEQASEKIGWGLQIHIDDHHGETDYSVMTDEEIIAESTGHHTGCGFAAYAWGDQGTDVIAMAKERHWRIQVLHGNHEESGAIMNKRVGHTFMTVQGIEDKAPRFNTDVADAEKMFGILGEMLKDDSFAAKAVEWNTKTYKDVVVALKGVKSADEVEVNE